ncbi:MAG: CDGSH iron-sulfur domain-containing protein [Bacteroidales bacterium]|jgi:CDGSH-type Zn-finger protein|nr:CDGSH iron-sulfur domain-containing protein [Bacteroidales bacterium]MDD4383965.1 CDGSH iron-sulfur domain-containing protein [Bacteroidales bacterium]MDY0196370.1 CDGSH iron-sulfur domain-containing protein [Tenuifilaceae bacterium]
MQDTKNTNIHTEVKINKGGPIKITGKFQISGTDGSRVDDENQNEVYLCACGKSKKKPFCDGSHNG